MPNAPARIFLSLALACALPAASRATGLDGVWLRDDGAARVRIAPCGDKICATNLWIRDESKGEAAGDKLIMSLSAASSGQYSGTAYDPKRRMTYSVDVKVGQGALETKGCVLYRLLCRSVSWRQVN